MKIGQSYNPAMVQDSTLVQSDASLVELGLHEISVVNDLSIRDRFPNLSLHIARSPLVEDCLRQEIFLHKLEEVLRQNSFMSLGFHLCGARNSGIGRLGFTPHFDVDELVDERISTFIAGVRQIFSGEIWFENANFYSHSEGNAKDSYRFLTSLAERFQIGIILDLSHVFIEASNLGVSPCRLLSEINFGLVREIHLSGIIHDTQGVLHDGHSQPIASQTWSLLEVISPELSSECFITIEHSDPIFQVHRDLFDADFSRLRDWLTSRKPQQPHCLSPVSYAKKYVAKILLRHIRNLEHYMLSHQLLLHEEVDRFIDQLPPSISLVIDSHEVDYFPPSTVKHLAQEFLHHLKQIGLP